MNDYQIGTRTYHYQTSMDELLEADDKQAFLCHLPHMQCVSVIGDNSQSFLQGQFSCNVNLVNDHHFLRGLLCSLKGRIIADVDILYCYDYQLVMPKDITEKTLKVLRTPAMLSKVNLKPTDKYTVFGIIGNPETLNLPVLVSKNEVFAVSQNNKAALYRVDEDMWILLVANNDAVHIQQTNQNQLKGSLSWHYLSLKRGRPSIYSETQGEFLPHRLEYHLTPGLINFEKGCFRGQEIVARTHYRAKLKHGYITYTQNEKPVIGGQIIHDEKDIGEIVDWCPIQKNLYLVAAIVHKEFSNDSAPFTEKPY